MIRFSGKTIEEHALSLVEWIDLSKQSIDEGDQVAAQHLGPVYSAAKALHIAETEGLTQPYFGTGQRLDSVNISRTRPTSNAPLRTIYEAFLNMCDKRLWILFIKNVGNPPLHHVCEINRG